MRTVGVILAGGVGARLGMQMPKQMVKVAGKTILEHTVGIFADSSAIDEVIVMITPGWSEYVATMLGDRYRKLTLILEGGETRNETTQRVFDALGSDDLKIVLHDAVRPLLDESILHDCVSALDSYDAVDVVIPSTDTIVEVDADGIITSIPDRSTLRRGQTPQAFKLSVLKAAYEKASSDPFFSATDDCGVVLKYLPDVPIKTIDGSEHNIKVTHPVDLFIADRLFQLASKTISDSQHEWQTQLSGKTIVVLGGSYGIGAEIALLARQAGAQVVSHGRSTTGLDVTDSDALKSALEQAHREHGRIDAVVLTAGALRISRLNDSTDQDVLEAVNINYLAPVNVARAAYPYLKESQGHLLYFTSSSYTRGRENYSLYSSSKAAVVNLTQALADEWSNQNIKVNVVNPERTATLMRTNAFGEEPPGTLLTAQEVAQTSLAVLGSSWTGAVIDVRNNKS